MTVTTFTLKVSAKEIVGANPEWARLLIRTNFGGPINFAGSDGTWMPGGWYDLPDGVKDFALPHTNIVGAQPEDCRLWAWLEVAIPGEEPRRWGPYEIDAPVGTTTVWLNDCGPATNVPADWRDPFRDEIVGITSTAVATTTAIRDEVQGYVIGELGTTDSQTATLVATPGTLTGGALSAAMGDQIATPGSVARTETEAVAQAVSTEQAVALIQHGRLSPIGSLSWSTATGITTFRPMTVGEDGVVYGRFGGGLFAARLNSGGTALNGSVSFEGKSEHSGGGKVRWASKTNAGYVVITAVGATTYIWFSTTWTAAGFSKVATIGKLANDRLGIPQRFRTAEGVDYLFVAIWDSGASKKPVYASFNGGSTWGQIRESETAVDGEINNHWHDIAWDDTWKRIWLSGGDGPNSWFGYGQIVDKATFDVDWTGVPMAEADPVYDGKTYQQPTAIVPFEERICLGPDRGLLSPGVWRCDPLTGHTVPQWTLDATVTGPDKKYPVSPYARSGNVAYLAYPASSSMPSGSRNHTDIVATGDGGRSWHKVSTVAWGASDLQENGICGPDANGRLWMVGPSGLQWAQRLAWAPA